MRTACSSSHRGGGLQGGPGIPQSRHPPGTRHPQSRHPPEQAPRPDPPQLPLGCVPGSDPPQFPPWLWVWTRSPSISPWLWAWTRSPPLPLGCGPGDPLETCCKACWDTTCNACWDCTPPVDRHTPVSILPCPKLLLRAVTTEGHLVSKNQSNTGCVVSTSSRTIDTHFMRKSFIPFRKIRTAIRSLLPGTHRFTYRVITQVI